jgi:hypothetical protein
VAAISGGGSADFLPDLRTAESARALARRAVDARRGHVDLLINSAGIAPAAPTPCRPEAQTDIACASAVEITAVITCLASDDSSHVNSAILPVDGGRTAT